ncbi:ATP-binding cassette domain-containing protein [Candidatus Halocynthiibacter alkanivorans]|jgi:putative thiamine transport system ATP-binding protein|uniref:ATP-binding cassette domain-containing protein n=1 Tax=Candidatus Halocynthiibacter alkanivorans TaxID=2267619 RepID=UPI000DF47F49|nr:ATP-binding cassette domain-containing protein [Candidatus Halocynthiibacter alkanivorans]
MTDTSSSRQQGLSLQNLRISRGTSTLTEIDAHIDPGEVLSLMGPSGSGKSTLLAAITGTLDPAFTCSGLIRLDGRDITAARPEQRNIGILFQDDLLFPHLSVGANLAFGLRPTKHRAARISVALADIGLDGFDNRDPATLSGGQKARVALMRMLLSEPAALLLDEPFSGLDATLRAQMRTLVFARAREQGLPVLLVTHDLEDAQASGGKIIQMQDVHSLT